MAVKASAETIREMKKQIAQTIKDIERINHSSKVFIISFFILVLY